MASTFDLRAYEELETPEQQELLSAALRKKSRYGAIGQLMGVKPTSDVGAGLQDQANASLKMALGRRQEARDAAARAAEQAAAQKRWEAEQAESKRQFGANYGLKEQELGLAKAKAEREAQGGDWKVRIDPYGNPLGWMNDRGDFMTVDQQFFPAPGGGSSAPRGGPTANQAIAGPGGPAQPTAGPIGGGGGGRAQPQPSPFGLPPTAGSPQTFGGPQPSVGSAQIGTGSTPPPPGGMADLSQYDESRQAMLRQARIKSLPAEQQNKYGTAIAQRERLPSLIQQVEANRGAFGITQDIAQHIPGQPGTVGGVVQGLTRNIQDKYRNPESAKVRSRVYQEAYEVIHALAGAALSTGEANRILGFMPGPTDPPEKILANLASAYEEANRTISTIEGAAGVPEQIRSRGRPLPSPQVQGQPQGAPEEIIDLPPRSR